MKQMVRNHKILDKFGGRLDLNADNKFELDGEEIGGGGGGKLYLHTYCFVATGASNSIRFQISFTSSKSSLYSVDELFEKKLTCPINSIYYTTNNIGEKVVKFVNSIKFISNTQYKITYGYFNVKADGTISSFALLQNTSETFSKSSLTLIQDNSYTYITEI